MLDEKIELYIEEVREKNKDKSIDYNKLIAKCPYITNKKELDLAKKKLEDLDKENLEFYNHIIDLIKDKNTDLNSLYLLYKEYNDVELIRNLLAEEIYNKEIELDITKKNFNKDNDNVKEIEKSVKELKSMGGILDDLSKTISVDIDNLFVIGRCISADFKAQAALRVQSSCFSMGEGAAKYIINTLKEY